jgi:hypothetical protein
MEEIFLHCGIQQKTFSSVVEYNGGGFPPLWDTMEEVFLHREIQWKRYISLWDTMEINYTMQNGIFKFFNSVASFILEIQCIHKIYIFKHVV